MSLLANELILSSVELKNCLNNQAKNRLEQTSQAFKQSPQVETNLSVLKSLNKQNIQPQSYQSLIESFLSLIYQTPLNYVNYYNLFNLHAKQGNYSQALKHLIQSISCLLLVKSLEENQQKLLSLVLRQYCSGNVLIYLIKAILHVRNQKYVIAVNDLNWIKEQLQEKSDQIKTLIIIKEIYGLLGKTDKENSIQQKINQLNNEQSQTASQTQLFKLSCTVQFPSQQAELKLQLSKRLKEFSDLLKEKQLSSLKTTSTQPNIIFKKIAPSDLSKKQINKNHLIEELKTTWEESPLYTKGQEKGLSKSSERVSQNQSMQIVASQVQNFIKHRYSTKQNGIKPNSSQKLSMSIKSNPKKDSLQTSMQQQKPLNISQQSPQQKKKKTQNIYPLQTLGQQVQVKLVMAQLTNNKQLVGNMDPYCVLSYNGLKKNSTVAKGQGMEPRWKQSFTWNLTDNPSDMIIQVFDKENFFKKDDFVGSGNITIEKNGLLKVQLFQNQKQAGTVFVTIQAKR